MKKVLVIIVSVIVILLIVFFAYTSFKKKSVSIINEEPVSEVDDTQAHLGKVEGGVYINDTYGFSLPLPAGMTATNFNEGEGTTILVSKTDPVFQMQIFVSPFDEDISLSIARIKKDIPDMKMIDPIEINTGGVATVAFYSTADGEKHREIWFVHGGFLYQVLAKASDDNTTGTVMEGWKWKE